MSKPERIVAINTSDEPSGAFERIMRGVDLLANSVKSTLGPYGRNFLLEKSGTRVTNDGITIAREIQAKDEIEELGVRVVREAAIKTNEDAGDGTTTATTLTQAILKECSRFLPKKNQLGSKRSVMSLNRSLEKESKEVIELLKAKTTPIETKEQLIDVARVSVEDDEMAELIGSAQFDLGKDGMIVVEETTDMECSVEKIQGIRIDNGLGTSMVMNDQERHRLVLEDVPVLYTNYTINDLGVIKHVLDKLVTAGHRDIVVMARAFSSEAIQAMMQNHSQGIRLYPMQAPYVNQREIMTDMQAVLGGKYIHDESEALESMSELDAGMAKKVIGYRYSAIFTGEGREEEVKERVETLKKEKEGEPSKFNKKALDARISQLTNGFALLKVGSISDTDRKYKYDKAEDAVNAVRSALQEGTVRGAGIALKEISDELTEEHLLKRPLRSIYDQIMTNAGETFEVEEWVRNSAKTDRVAIENACRIAADLITVGGAIATEKIKPIDQMLKPKTNEE